MQYNGTNYASSPLDHREDRVGRDVDLTDGLHLRLPLGLLREQLHLPRHVTAVALGEDVLSNRFDPARIDDVAPDPGLDDDQDQLRRDLLHEDLDHLLGQCQRARAVADCGERVRRRLVDVDLEFHQVSLPVVERPVVHGSVARSSHLHLCEEIANHLRHRHLKLHEDSALCQEIRISPDRTSLEGNVHRNTYGCLGHDHVQQHVRLLYCLDQLWIWEHVCKLDVDGLAAFQINLVDHRRRGDDEVHAVLALQPLLHYLHVQHAEEAAAEA
mmetsp:Transcript_16155/g.44913  ORF Transcript_16155/g.44913 Transcript_16155/m.44913 type:complete len:271 (-) Transcript_16155:1216-2028(-)